MRPAFLWKAAIVALAFSTAACQCGKPPTISLKDDGGTDVPADDGGLPPDDGGVQVDGGLLLPDGGVVAVVPTDPNDLSNETRDSDCDGLTDAEEYSQVYFDGKKTHPGIADSDFDGILDGVEFGRTTSVNTGCGFVGDADPSTRTNPTSVDTDSDGLPDGLEDSNFNGRAEGNETDATKPDTDGDGLDDGVEDANQNGVVDTGETDPRMGDTDGDQALDGLEVAVMMTSPLLADTDGDSCLDTAEDFNRNGVVDVGETNPNNPPGQADCGTLSVALDADQDGIRDALETATGTDPNNADSDGDGLPDGLEDRNKNGAVNVGETDPRLQDSDCDGLLDGPSMGGIPGEDLNANGMVDTGETDPAAFDTDGDGLGDGLELGRTTADSPRCDGIFVPDSNPASTTNPTLADSDGDGVADGAEDANQNGDIDTGELNPNDNADVTPTVTEACSANNLRPVTFAQENQPDIQLAVEPGFTEIKPIVQSGSVKGLMGYNPTTQVAFLVYRQAAPGASTTAVGDETALRTSIQTAVGSALTGVTTQSFKTWDDPDPVLTNFNAVLAFYNAASADNVQQVANSIANGLVGANAGVLSTGGGPFAANYRIQAEYVHRSNDSVVVVLAVAPKATFDDATTGVLFTMDDTAGGSSLAQFGDRKGVQCEKFTPASQKVDIIFVVDDSCSMASQQTQLGIAANAIADRLNNSTLDWRIAMVTTHYHFGSGNNSGVRRGFTTNIDQFRAWLTQNSACNQDGNTRCGNLSPAPNPLPLCDSNGPEANGNNGGCWISTAGSGSEGLLGAARKVINNLWTNRQLTPSDPVTVNGFRDNAEPVVILLGDADDQTSGYSSAAGDCGGSGCENVNNFIGFFQGNGAVGTPGSSTTRNPFNRNITVHGLVCPNSGSCTDYRPGPSGNPAWRHVAVMNATGGKRGNIMDTNPTGIQASINEIVDNIISQVSYRTLKPPIGASIKVAVDAVENASCYQPGGSKNVPRSRVNGFDFTGSTRTISFFGTCRPTAAPGNAAAVSYRYWIDSTPSPDGNNPPCFGDPKFTPNEADFCLGRLACNLTTQVCECPANCGSEVPPGQFCNTNPDVCDFQCLSDCGGNCTQYQVCNATSCGCECRQMYTCPAGYTFSNNGSTCGCVCDTSALNCGPTQQPDANSCACVCKPQCGGCPDGTSCNASTCTCQGGIN